MLDGVLVVDKPAGPTSHDVVAVMRRVLGEPRIGHTGTLDPSATGVLPLVVGRATRLARFLSAADKEYVADIRLGFATDTYDATGKPIDPIHGGPWPARADVLRCLDEFRGDYLQRPPAFSAKKVAGRRSYKTARRAAASGDDILVTAPAPVPVAVRRLDLTAFEGDTFTVTVACSAGFYVRSLAHDIGQRLGTGAHLTSLRRTRSGEFAIADALPLATIEQHTDAARCTDAVRQAIVPVERILSRLPIVVLTDEGRRHAAEGRDLSDRDADSAADFGSAVAAPLVRLFDRTGHLVGIGTAAVRPGLLHPSVVLV